MAPSDLPRPELPVLPRDLGRLHHAPLGRAVGRGARTVLDATGGFGNDALLLAAMGLQVRCVERHPRVWEILVDVLRRAAADATLAAAAARVTLEFGDFRELALEPGDRPDIVHLDPMFPPKRRRSASPPRDAALLQAWVGEEPDADALLGPALALARRRVLWKRPPWAPPSTPRPTVVYPGQRVRYDVWVVPGGAQGGGALPR
jgi:16S rRNA (guanine1516-N2)-methyltransferase